VSDERDGAGSAGDGTETPDDGDSGSPTAVVTARPQRPSGKRSRREGAGTEVSVAASTTEDGDGKKPKKPKKPKKTGPSRNPITFVINYLQQVVAELRKVIWPNRKQMVSYTTVVLVFLVFMVAMISGVDMGFAKVITMVFG
jgi:preprotein translocase subunit SecE